MALGAEVCLGPGHIVLDGDPAPSPQKRAQAPQFSVYVYCGELLYVSGYYLVWR